MLPKERKSPLRAFQHFKAAQRHQIMADKETTTFVVDIGPHMLQKSNGRDSSDLEHGLRYVRDVTATKALKGRKTDYVTVVTANTDDTSGKSGSEGVELVFQQKPPTYDDIKLLNLSHSESTTESNIVQGILVGLQNILEFTNKKKFKKNVIVVTNSCKSTDLIEDDYFNALQMTLADNSINLIIIGVDFDSTENTSNVEQWLKLQTATPGSRILSGTDVTTALGNPPTKITRPTKLFEIQFRIGANLADPSIYTDTDNTKKSSRTTSKDAGYWSMFEEDSSCLCFTVEGYGAVRRERPQPGKVYGLNPEGVAKPIKAETSYEVHWYNNDYDNENELENDDDDELKAKQFDIEVVESDKLVHGYKYGKSTVVLNEALKQKRIYKTIPGLDIRGIVDQSKLPRCYLTDEATFVFGSKGNTNDKAALAAVVDALHSLDSVAIARFVKTPESEVQMVVLMPVYIKKNDSKRSRDDIGEDTRALIMTRLPFFEDEKISTFPELTELKTTSGKIITEHPLLPDTETKNLMDQLVDALDVDKPSDKETDFEGDKRIFNPAIPVSQLPLPYRVGNHDNIVKYSTHLHRVSQTIKDIIINSSKTSLPEYLKQPDIIPPLHPVLERDIYPDPKLLLSAQSILDKLAAKLQVKKVDKTSARKRKQLDDEIDEPEDFEELSLEELLARGARD